jgi:hypothetical protein
MVVTHIGTTREMVGQTRIGFKGTGFHSCTFRGVEVIEQGIAKTRRTL